MNANDINQKPSANATYALNTVPVTIIATTETVTVTLKIGNDIIFTGQYAPDFNNRIRVDFADLYQAHVSSIMPGASDTEVLQDKYRTNFTQVIQGTTGDPVTVTYKVCNAKINSVTAFETWLGSHFITNQAVEKYTNHEAKEYLTHYNPAGALTVYVVFYPTEGGTEEARVFRTDTNGFYTVDVSYSRLIALINLLPGAVHSYYDVELREGTKVLATQRYIYRERSGKEKYFCFVNALGGIDTLICDGENVLEPETTHNVGRFGGTFISLDDTDDMRSWSQNTGYFERNRRNWIYELFSTKKAAAKYDFEAQTMTGIVVTESNVKVSDNDLLDTATFTYINTDYVGGVVADGETPSQQTIHDDPAQQEEPMMDISEKEEPTITNDVTEAVEVKSTVVYVYYEVEDGARVAAVYYYINGSSTPAGSFTPTASSGYVAIEVDWGDEISFNLHETGVNRIVLEYYKIDEPTEEVGESES